MIDDFEYIYSDGLGARRSPKKTNNSARDKHWDNSNQKDEIKKHKSALAKLIKPRPSHDWLEDEDKMKTHFGLLNVPFGNSANEPEKDNIVYASAISLHHIAQAIGVKDVQMGLGGNLKLSIAGHGKGQEGTQYYAINQEEKEAGVLNVSEISIENPLENVGEFAHHYALAIDNNIGLVSNPKRPFATEDKKNIRTTRKTYEKDKAKSKDYFIRHFEEFFHKLYWNGGKKTAFQIAVNSSTSDTVNSRREVFARTFEVYIMLKLRAQKISNKFVVKSRYSSDPLYPSESLVKLVTPLLDKILKYAYSVFERSEELNGLAIGITGYDGLRKTIKHNGNVQDTLDNMKRIALRDVYQIEQLAHWLKGDTVEQTCSNLWHYFREHLKYKFDKAGIEELRTPARSMKDGTLGMEGRKGFGIDCDDFTILVVACLLANKIDSEMVAVSYKGLGEFQHVYPVAYDEQGNRFVIDIVPEIPRFNYEHQPITDIKKIPMQIHELSGFGSTEADEKAELIEELSQPFSLSGLEEDLEDEILENTFLAGFGEVATEEEADIILSGSEILDMADKGILAEVAKAFKSLSNEEKNLTVLSETIDVEEEKEILADLMENWSDPDERKDVLVDAIERKSPFTNFYKAILFSLDKLANNPALNGVDEIYLSRVDMADYEEDLDGLGRTRKRRLRNFFKKVGGTVKKGIKAVVRYNPTTIATRNAALLALKTNAFGISEKLIYGYLSEGQSKDQGLNMDAWRKTVNAVRIAEKYFQKLGGKQENFRNAVIKGRAAKKTGLQLVQMGAVPAFVATVLNLFKQIPKIIPPKEVREANKAKRQAEREARKAGKDGTETEDLPLVPGDPVPEPTGDESAESPEEEEKKEGWFAQKATAIKTWYGNNTKLATYGTIGAIVLILAIIFAPKIARAMQKKKNVAMGRIKANQTRAVNKALSEHKGGNSTSKRPKGRPKQLPAKSNTRGKAKGKPMTNGERFKEMHRIAKKMQKDHPKTKYHVLLGRASNQLKK